jgi:hypothetical protein
VARLEQNAQKVNQLLIPDPDTDLGLENRAGALFIRETNTPDKYGTVRPGNHNKTKIHASGINMDDLKKVVGSPVTDYMLQNYDVEF